MCTIITMIKIYIVGLKMHCVYTFWGPVDTINGVEKLTSPKKSG